MTCGTSRRLLKKIVVVCGGGSVKSVCKPARRLAVCGLTEERKWRPVRDAELNEQVT